MSQAGQLWIAKLVCRVIAKAWRWRIEGGDIRGGFCGLTPLSHHGGSQRRLRGDFPAFISCGGTPDFSIVSSLPLLCLLGCLFLHLFLQFLILLFLLLGLSLLQPIQHWIEQGLLLFLAFLGGGSTTLKSTLTATDVQQLS